MRSRGLGNCGWLDSSQRITQRSGRSGQNWTRRKLRVTNLCPSAKGFERVKTRSQYMRGDLKAAKERVEEAERNLVAAQSGLEQSQAKALEIEKALQERRTHLEHLHRQAAAEASRGPEATPLDAVLPDDLTEHLSKHWPPGAEVTFQRAMDLYLESRKTATKDAVETGPKQGMDVDEFGGLDDEIVPITEERFQSSVGELLQAQTRGESEKLAELRSQMARDFVSSCAQETEARVAPLAGARLARRRSPS